MKILKKFIIGLVIATFLFGVNVAYGAENSIQDGRGQWVGMLDYGGEPIRSKADSSGYQYVTLSSGSAGAEIGTIDTAFGSSVCVGGAKAESTVPTEVSDQDAVALWADTFGRPWIKGYNPGAAALDVNPVAAFPVDTSHYQIIDQLLDADPTSVSSAWIYVGDCSEVGFWVTYDETEVGNAVTGTLTVDISNDASNTDDGLFYDIGGTTTAQTTETLDGDQEYQFWVKTPGLASYNSVYVQVDIAGVNTDADDTGDYDVWIYTRK